MKCQRIFPYPESEGKSASAGEAHHRFLAEVAQVHECKDRNLSEISIGAGPKAPRSSLQNAVGVCEPLRQL